MNIGVCTIALNPMISEESLMFHTGFFTDTARCRIALSNHAIHAIKFTFFQKKYAYRFDSFCHETFSPVG